MTFEVTRVAFDGLSEHEFGLLVVDGDATHCAIAVYRKPEGADASIFGVTCHLRAVSINGEPVLRVSRKPIEVSHAATEAKCVHRLDPEGITAKLLNQSLQGAIQALLEEIAVEAGNQMIYSAGLS